MGIITKIEDKLGNIVEKPFRPRKGLDPLSIEIALKRTIEGKKQNILGKIVVPDEIVVILDAEVYNEYKPFLENFSKSLSESLRKWLDEKGYGLLNEISVDFRKGPLDRGKFDIAVSYRGTDKEGLRSGRPISRRNGLNDGEGSASQDAASCAVGGTLIYSGTGERFVLREGETLIGRSSQCAVRIHDETVSRQHVSISLRHGKAILKDLNSACGTRVNSQKITKKLLRHGDRVTLGRTELIFEVNNGKCN